MQIESQSLGYTTSIIAPKSYIHSPNRPITCTQVIQSLTNKFHVCFTSEFSTESVRTDSEYTVKDQIPKQKYQSSNLATTLVLKFYLSTRQASWVCMLPA